VLELVTMSDLRFLPQLLTLHRSLVRRGGQFHLSVLATDAASAAFLRARRPAGIEVLELAALERTDPELAATRRDRTWTEYCWTTTPSLCRDQLERAPSGATVIWVDADVEFLRDPGCLSRALGDGSILLTPHRYNRAYPSAALASELTALYGRFNGGTIVFRRDEQGIAAADLWRRRTLQWCFDRCEPGRYGNQLHLEDFPERFSGTRVLDVPGGVLGPWNGGRFRIRSSPAGPLADGRPVLAYHYQSLRLHHPRPRVARQLSPNVFPLATPTAKLEACAQPHYRLSRRERRLLWRPHATRLAAAVEEVLAYEPAFLATLAPPPSRPAVPAVIRQGMALRAGQLLLPLWRALPAHVISVSSRTLAHALLRRGRRLR
jgi:hypothetical protein